MFDKKKIGIGIDDFKTVIEKNYYFVDKSKLIDVWCIIEFQEVAA